MVCSVLRSYVLRGWIASVSHGAVLFCVVSLCVWVAQQWFYCYDALINIIYMKIKKPYNMSIINFTFLPFHNISKAQGPERSHKKDHTKQSLLRFFFCDFCQLHTHFPQLSQFNLLIDSNCIDFFCNHNSLPPK